MNNTREFFKFVIPSVIAFALSGMPLWTDFLWATQSVMPDFLR